MRINAVDCVKNRTNFKSFFTPKEPSQRQKEIDDFVNYMAFQDYMSRQNQDKFDIFESDDDSDEDDNYNPFKN